MNIKINKLKKQNLTALGLKLSIMLSRSLTGNQEVEKTERQVDHNDIPAYIWKK